MNALIPVIPGYKILTLLHDDPNTMGFRGIRIHDSLPVILKMLKQAHVNPMGLSRFHNEYEVSQLLKSNRTLRIYSLESFEQNLILVCEYFDGARLDQLLHQWQLAGTELFPLSKFLTIAGQIVDGLAEIHSAGVIHKDLHPSAIILNTSTGLLKIGSFGLATAISRSSPALKNPMVLEGVLESALAYMSPEQTGRMNRTVDYRTDFYSLGVTFYEMLTGHLPFEMTDAIELVHAHLAKTPVRPSILNPAIPSVLADLVLKLMSKAPEDRYQSTHGLKRDLDLCLRQLQLHGGVQEFKLGGQDRAERFIIPEKLYGRTAEIASILAAFDCSARGRIELMLVNGLPGIGKTSLINEAHKAIIQQHGRFIKGKFDPFKRNIPFSAFIEALRDFMGQILAEREAPLKQWKERILSALGENGQVIIDIIPELEKIIGLQPPVAELSGNAAKNRFNLLLLKFIASITVAEHPVAIFLDDLHWADRDSLKLIQQLASERISSSLFLIGAYRDNEVSDTHPLSLAMSAIGPTESAPRIITLAPLHMSDINQLIADALSCSPEMALPLTEVVYRITQGNPFFSNEFLKALYEEGLISSNRETGSWQCDIALVSELTLTDDVVEFLASRLQKLPESTQEVLKLAACIGDSFDLGILATISRLSLIETVSQLRNALQAGIILPQSDTAKLFPGSSGGMSGKIGNADSFASIYGFLHERVRQAAYSLIPAEQKQQTHLNIARLLLHSSSENEKEEKLFEIVNQYNQGIQFITDPAERWELTELNLRAGQKSKASIAYRAAWEYFSVALKLLPQDSWRTHYDFALNFYESIIEAAYLNGDFEKMETLAQVALEETRIPLDRIKIFEVRCEALTGRGKFAESIDAGFEILQSLGVIYPREPNQHDIDTAMQETISAYANISIEELMELPLMTDPYQLAAARVSTNISSPAYVVSPNLFTFLAIRDVALSIQYGNSPASAYVYAAFGQILCRGIEGKADIDSGYRFGQLALKLVKQLGDKELECKVQAVVYGYVAHCKQHFGEMLTPLRTAYDNAIQCGNFQFAGYAAYLYCAFPYFAGVNKEISELQRETAFFGESIRQMRQTIVLQYFGMLQQALHDLRDGRVTWRHLKGQYYDEEIMLSDHLQANDRIGLFDVNFHKLLLNYLFGEYQQAAEDAEKAKQHLKGIKDFPYLPIFYLYDSLAHLSAYREHPQSSSDTLLALIDANQEKMKEWATFAPMNCLHKYYLVEAERYRIMGDKARAIEEYTRAAASARENGYLREEALAKELSATFFLDCGEEKQAKTCLEEARDGYLRWGANAKASQLERRYHHLLMPIASPQIHTAFASDAILTNQSRSAGGMSNIPLDLATVVKASQAIAGELELAPLITQLMRIVIENAGAQRGALLLERDGKWIVEALGHTDGEQISILQSRNLQTSHVVSTEIVSRVSRTLKSIVLDDAARDGDFIHDPYIKQHRIKSVICAPLVNQGKLSGIVYLENNLASHAFASGRLELINLLSAQMALSLDNARLYQNAQQEIEDRKQVEISLRESEERFRSLVETTNDWVWEAAMNGAYTYASPKSVELLGYFPEEIVGKQASDFIIPEEREKMAVTFHEIAAELKPFKGLSSTFRHKDGHRVVLETNATAFFNAKGEILGYRGIDRDITERKRVEMQIRALNEELEKRVEERTKALEDANKELEAFSYSVSHDLRTPLRAIDGYTRILLEDYASALDAEGNRFCAIIRNQTLRMSHLIDDLLAFSRLSRAGLHKITIDMEKLVQTVFQELATPEIRKHMDFTIYPLSQAFGDITLIHQVWSNLIGNAIKFSSGSKRTVIEVRSDQRNNETVYSVRDNGAGFDMRYVDKLFGVFQRLHSESEFEGTGVGLAIVQRVIRRHGGCVWAEGKIGEGATFYFSLPHGREKAQD